MHRMIGAGGAVPGDGSGEFAGARVQEENGASLRGDDVEQRGKELPLERVNVSHGADGGTDLEKSGKGAREANRRRKSRERFRLQVEEFFGLELPGRETEGGVVIKLDRTAFGGRGRFLKKQEGRIADGDLVAKGKHAFADGNAVDESARGRIEITQDEASGSFRNGAMLRSYGGVFETDGIRRIAADRKRCGDGKRGVFPRAADDSESWEHDLGLGRLDFRVTAEGRDSNSVILNNLYPEN